MCGVGKGERAFIFLLVQENEATGNAPFLFARAKRSGKRKSTPKGDTMFVPLWNPPMPSSELLSYSRGSGRNCPVLCLSLLRCCRSDAAALYCSILRCHYFAAQYAEKTSPGICLWVMLKPGEGRKGGEARRAPPLLRFSFHILFAHTKRIWPSETALRAGRCPAPAIRGAATSAEGINPFPAVAAAQTKLLKKSAYTHIIIKYG